MTYETFTSLIGMPEHGSFHVHNRSFLFIPYLPSPICTCQGFPLSSFFFLCLCPFMTQSYVQCNPNSHISSTSQSPCFFLSLQEPPSLSPSLICSSNPLSFFPAQFAVFRPHNITSALPFMLVGVDSVSFPDCLPQCTEINLQVHP